MRCTFWSLWYAENAARGCVAALLQADLLLSDILHDDLLEFAILHADLSASAILQADLLASDSADEENIRHIPVGHTFVQAPQPIHLSLSTQGMIKPYLSIL